MARIDPTLLLIVLIEIAFLTVVASLWRRSLPDYVFAIAGIALNVAIFSIDLLRRRAQRRVSLGANSAH